MTRNTTIRKATPEDIHTIYELGRTVDEFVVNHETVYFWPEELLLNATRLDNVLILVAEDEANTITGFTVVNYNPGLRKALIENMYIKPDTRGQGIGDKLLATVFTVLLDQGCEYVATLVPPDAHNAIALYKKHGFSKGEQFVWLDQSLSDNFKK